MSSSTDSIFDFISNLFMELHPIEGDLLSLATENIEKVIENTKISSDITHPVELEDKIDFDILRFLEKFVPVYEGWPLKTRVEIQGRLKEFVLEKCDLIDSFIESFETIEFNPLIGLSDRENPKSELEDNRVTVLVLHGCCQGNLIPSPSGEEKIDIMSYGKVLWKKLGKTRRIVFARAPYLYLEENGMPRGLHWYPDQLDVADIPKGIPYNPKRHYPTLESLHKTIEQVGVDVLVGFSQGANVIDTYLAHYNEPFPLSHAVLFSGYGFTCEGEITRRVVTTPTLFVGCPDDNIVPWPPRFVSYEHFECWEHAGNKNNPHVLPSKKPFVNDIIEWIIE